MGMDETEHKPYIAYSSKRGWPPLLTTRAPDTEILMLPPRWEAVGDFEMGDSGRLESVTVKHTGGLPVVARFAKGVPAEVFHESLKMALDSTILSGVIVREGEVGRPLPEGWEWRGGGWVRSPGEHVTHVAHEETGTYHVIRTTLGEPMGDLDKKLAARLKVRRFMESIVRRVEAP